MPIRPDAERVPPLDLRPELEALWEPLSEAALRVLQSGRFVLGPEVEAFETEAAEFLDVKHAVGLNSGTDALVIGLRCLGVEPGDEVITTPFSFFATAEAISSLGAIPVFVDIEPDSFNIDVSAIESAITARTRALLPVHLFGRPADM
ncbi:MAG: DegT/DnrJ/EryC1/StrS family aminotransferase, partial [marine benthic group bacterium]|nr:DegT/DnrJ/EryC1/StrS family aminotransferase [Gemmatimonadota bacterium]